MTKLECPSRKKEQNIRIDERTFTVTCEYCGSRFNIPREHRVNKPTSKENTSSVNMLELAQSNNPPTP